MTKYIVDMNKGLYEQSWWNLLKPEVKLKAIKHWEDTDKIVDEKISSGEIKIDPSIPLRNMGVDIPSTDLLKKAITTDEAIVINQKNNPYIRFKNAPNIIPINPKDRRPNGKSTK